MNCSVNASPARRRRTDRWGAAYSLANVEKMHILHVLSLVGGNVTHAAEALGIGLRTLQRKLSEWSVNRHDYVLRGSNVPQASSLQDGVDRMQYVPRGSAVKGEAND